MARAKKVNPVNDMPVTDIQTESSESNVFDVETAKTKNNVVAISASSEPIQNDRDWSAIDSVLSDVVNFV